MWLSLDMNVMAHCHQLPSHQIWPLPWSHDGWGRKSPTKEASTSANVISSAINEALNESIAPIPGRWSGRYPGLSQHSCGKPMVFRSTNSGFRASDSSSRQSLSSEMCHFVANHHKLEAPQPFMYRIFSYILHFSWLIWFFWIVHIFIGCIIHHVSVAPPPLAWWIPTFLLDVSSKKWWSMGPGRRMAISIPLVKSTQSNT